MNNIAIITARGGSKRIPKKNIKEFCGKPIIQYSIEAAVSSGIFNEIMVSTDDDEIAEIAIRNGAKVPFKRSLENSSDFATTSDAIKEVLQNYRLLGENFDNFCCIYPTAPFITGKKLAGAMEKMLNNKAESILPVVKFSFPPQRAVLIKDNRIKFKWPENINSRSQDLEVFYHDAGQFYCMNVDAFLKHNSLITNKTIPYILNDLEVQDIDNMEDWIIAEMKYKFIKK